MWPWNMRSCSRPWAHPNNLDVACLKERGEPGRGLRRCYRVRGASDAMGLKERGERGRGLRRCYRVRGASDAVGLKERGEPGRGLRRCYEGRGVAGGLYPPVAAARAASAENAVYQGKRDQPPGDLGLTGVGGVS